MRTKRLLVAVAAIYLVPLALATLRHMLSPDPTANPVRHGARLAPDPDEHPEAIFQLYAARAQGFKGIVAEHTWVAMKSPRAAEYQRYEVSGWRVHDERVIHENYRSPDRHWVGSQPRLLLDLRGCAAERAIDAVPRALERYPFAQRYVLWPGPNSNTFTAHLLRELPIRSAKLPPTAIGKDFVQGVAFIRAAGGSGFRLSAYGVLGVGLSLDEGVQLNLLGAVAGVDFADPALLLPGLGRIGKTPDPRAQNTRPCR